MIKLKLITPEKIDQVKSLLDKGVSIRETSRQTKISYYATWHISKGHYHKLNDLRDAFREPDNGYFNWDNFKVY